MKIQIKLSNDRLTATASNSNEIYFIEQGENSRFYVTATNGYNGYEGEGYTQIEQAIKYTKKQFKNH